MDTTFVSAGPTVQQAGGQANWLQDKVYPLHANTSTQLPGMLLLQHVTCRRNHLVTVLFQQLTLGEFLSSLHTQIAPAHTTTFHNMYLQGILPPASYNQHLESSATI